MKLFLEQFGIPTCVLNSELPASSRCRAVLQFNNGAYDIIIASDEKVLEEVKTYTHNKKLHFMSYFIYHILHYILLYHTVYCILLSFTATCDKNEKEQTKERQRIGRSARYRFPIRVQRN